MDTEMYYSLVKLNESVSDYLLGLRDEEFANEYGGIETLLNDMREAHENYERRYNTLTEDA